MRSRVLNEPEWRDLVAALCRVFSIRRKVELLESNTSPIPLTWGIIRPVIMLPDDASHWADRKGRLVLLHELAHIRRLDAGVQLAGRLAAMVYWFHPLVWYALGACVPNASTPATTALCSRAPRLRLCEPASRPRAVRAARAVRAHHVERGHEAP